MRSIFFVLIFCCCAGMTSAQNKVQKSFPSFEELHQRMMELQRQLNRDLENMNQPGSSIFELDTTFSFDMDTSFFIAPGFQGKFFFNGDSMLLHDTPLNLGDIFSRFFDQNDGDNPDGLWFGFPDKMKEGEEQISEGELSPEEKLRMEEEGEKPPKTPDPKEGTKATQKPKLKSIRI